MDLEPAALADLTGFGEGLGKTGTDLLPRHLHQTEAGHFGDLVPRAVPAQTLDQPPQQQLTVAGQDHVDEVDHDDAADVAEPELSDDLLGRLEVVARDGRFEVATGTGELAGVDVDDRHGFSPVDDERTARGQIDLALQRLGDLFVDAVDREHVTALGVPAFDALGEMRSDVADIGHHCVVGVGRPTVAMDDQLAEVLGEQVTDDPHGRIGLGIELCRRHPALDLFLDGLPLGLEAVDVPNELFLRRALGGSADNDAGVLTDEVRQDALEPPALGVGQLA